MMRLSRPATLTNTAVALCESESPPCTHTRTGHASVASWSQWYPSVLSACRQTVWRATPAWKIEDSTYIPTFVAHSDMSTSPRLLLVRGARLWSWDGDSEASSSSCTQQQQPTPHPSRRTGRLLPEPRDLEVDEKGRIRILPPVNVSPAHGKEGRADSSTPTPVYSAEIDARGLALLPGLMDAHIHMALTGESLAFLDLSACNSIEDLTCAVAGHVAKHPDQSWIIGVNWDQTKLGRYPVRSDIDGVSGDKKVFLWRACWHIGLANTSALLAAGIDVAQSVDALPAVSGGVIDVEDGAATGILRERAVELITAVAGKKSPEELRRFIVQAMSMCSRLGLTSVQTNDDRAIEVYRALQESNELPMRIFLTPLHNELDAIPPLPSPPARPVGEALPDDSLASKTSRLVADRVKIFSDGSLGAETAALRLRPMPFTTDSDSGSVDSEPWYKGVLIHSTEELSRMISRAKELGFRLEIHAIGDAAAEQVVYGLERSGITPADRPIITHCQVLGDDIIARMERLGVIANVQPSFVPTDMHWAFDRLDKNKLEFSYAWKTLLDRGVWVAGGSDAPIESCNPWRGIYDAIFRKERGNAEAPKRFRPEEALTFSEALWLYTVGAAYASNSERQLGVIEDGFVGDFVLVDPRIIDAEIDDANAELLRNYSPEVVVVGGEVVSISDASLRESRVTFSVPSVAHRGARAIEPTPSEVNTEATAPGTYMPGRNSSGVPLLLCGSADDLFAARPPGFCVCILKHGATNYCEFI